ncbi:hypothetical protein Glove_2g4 [Diversispora epigaea]|uniref:Uncharacterized protein n=1 Tax=Diversispora epigaea TaxID=1348612 RepID=A0A397K0E2_9GLOM|nr:hypothetical protein Glove_2g4 [Diversispora epigaea]
MSSTKDITTQTIPIHTVERSSTMCLTSSCLKKSAEQSHFTMLKVTCIQNIEYNVQLLPTMGQLSEEDIRRMDVLLSRGRLLVNISFNPKNCQKSDGKQFSLNTNKENIILKRLCQPEIWRQFGFSHIEPEKHKRRQFNKQYWLYADKQCSPSTSSSSSIVNDSIIQQPFGTLSHLTFVLNWITSNDDILIIYIFIYILFV